MRDVQSEVKTVLFGAGIKGQLLADCIHALSKEIFCIVDNDSSKWEAEYCGIPICSPQKLIELKGEFNIYITPDKTQHKEEIRSQIYELGYQKCIRPLYKLYEKAFNINDINSIIKAGMPLVYRSCTALDDFHLVFHGAVRRINMTFCCESGIAVPGVTLGESAEESIERLCSIREKTFAESAKFNLLDDEISDEERVFTAECIKCVRFRNISCSPARKQVQHINLSMYPSACQCNCIYCVVVNKPNNIYNEQLHGNEYKKIFETIEWLQANKMVSECVTWQVTCGEITIHPYKDRIYDLVKNSATTFHTNCFIFDERIAANLSANPYSSINLSIDSGTPETWYRVKGVNNFHIIRENLKKYLNSSTRPGQITLKYIVLPGINDDISDYQALVEIMKELKVSDLIVTCDVRVKYTAEPEQRKTIIRAAAELAANLYKNDMTACVDILSAHESEMVKDIAHELSSTI